MAVIIERSFWPILVFFLFSAPILTSARSAWRRDLTSPGITTLTSPDGGSTSSVINTPTSTGLLSTSVSQPGSTQPQQSTIVSDDGSMMTSTYTSPGGSAAGSVSGDPSMLPSIPFIPFLPGGFNSIPPTPSPTMIQPEQVSTTPEADTTTPVPDTTTPGSDTTNTEAPTKKPCGCTDFSKMFPPEQSTPTWRGYPRPYYHPSRPIEYSYTSPGYYYHSRHNYPSRVVSKSWLGNPWLQATYPIVDDWVDHDDDWHTERDWQDWNHEWDDSWNPPKYSAPVRDTLFSYGAPEEFSWDDVNYSWGEPGNPWGEVVAPWGDAESAWDEVDYQYGTPDEWGGYEYENPWGLGVGNLNSLWEDGYGDYSVGDDWWGDYGDGLEY